MRNSGRSTRRMTCWDGGDPSRLLVSADVASPPPCRPSLAMAAEPHPHACTYCPVAGPLSIRVTDMRRSGALTGYRGDAAKRRRRAGLDRGWRRPVRMRSGSVFLQSAGMVVGAQVLGCMHAGSILCWRCTGLRFWREGRLAALGIGRAAQGGVVPPQGNFAPPRAHGGGSHSAHSVTTLVRGRRASARGLRG